MFMIAATVYLILAGQPVGEPHRFNHRQSFSSLEACTDYLKSDAFGAERESLANGIRYQLEAEKPAGDAPVPDVTITASCAPDARL